MAAGGYVDYAPEDDTYAISDEVAFAMADPAGPTVRAPARSSSARSRRPAAWPSASRAARASAGTSTTMTSSRARSASSGPSTPRISSRNGSRALDGVRVVLADGARVADVGCGRGASTILMAEAFPASTFTGFDYHEPSIAHAREAAPRPGWTTV